MRNKVSLNKVHMFSVNAYEPYNNRGQLIQHNTWPQLPISTSVIAIG